MKIKCRKCDSLFKVKQTSVKQEDVGYPNGILCLKCWTKKNKTVVKVFPKKSEKKKEESKVQSKKEQYILDGGTGELIRHLYEVGDSAFIHTDKYGVILGEVLDVDSFDSQVYYSIGFKDSFQDFVLEEDIYDTAWEASAGEIVKI